MATSIRNAPERLVAAAALVGGALVAAGAFLPWLSLFAGLHPLRGVIGLNGRLLAAGGGVCLVAGVRYWLRPAPGLGRGVAVLGWVLTGYALWLIVQLLITYRELRTNPMLVPQLGPGLFVALGGALAAGITTALRGAGDLAAGGSENGSLRGGYGIQGLRGLLEPA